MIRNYLKIVLRSFSKNKSFSFINIIGLTSGLACSLLIFLYVSHESNYDTFHTDYKKIYRVIGNLNLGGNNYQMDGMSGGLGPILQENEPHVQNYIRIFGENEVIVSADGVGNFKEDQFLFVDPSFLEVFNFKVESGNPDELLEPGKVFLTESMALKYFGTRDVVGKILLYNREHQLFVSGIIAEPPSNSSINFDFLGSFASTLIMEDLQDRLYLDQVSLGSFTTYLKIDNPSSVDGIEQTLSKLTIDEKSSYSLQELSANHLYGFGTNSSNARNVYVFLVIGILILALAIINYINLTTSRSVIRSKEIGVRKTLGAGRISLSFQFLAESAFIIGIAMILSILLVVLLQPLASQYLNIELTIQSLFSWRFALISTAIYVTSIILSGAYPAYLISKFKPSEVLKGSRSAQGIWMQKGFTLTQFAISMGLIFCSVVISLQVSYMKNQPIGLEKDQVLVVNLAEGEGQGAEFLKNKLNSIPGIENVSFASFSLYKGGYSMYFTRIPESEEDITLHFIAADKNFGEILGLEWIYKPLPSSNEQGLIINETAAERLNLNGSPIGEKVSLGNQSKEILGMVKDFNYSSLKSEIGPMVIHILNDTSRNFFRGGASVYLKLESGYKVSPILSDIEDAIGSFDPGTPFEYYFVDDAFNELYKTEEKLGSLVTSFSGLALFIAFLGMFGLITFSLERRVREIGIRKVFGSSTFQLLKLFISEYIWIILLSTLLAIPLSWYTMDAWLQNFTARIDFNFWIFVIPVFLVCLLSWGTIALKSWRISSINPAEIFRTE